MAAAAARVRESGCRGMRGRVGRGRFSGQGGRGAVGAEPETVAEVGRGGGALMRGGVGMRGASGWSRRRGG